MGREVEVGRMAEDGRDEGRATWDGRGPRANGGVGGRTGG